MRNIPFLVSVRELAKRGDISPVPVSLQHILDYCAILLDVRNLASPIFEKEI
jgi:hypothetical protein